MPELADFVTGWDWAPPPPVVGEPAPTGIQWVEEPVPLEVFVRDQKYLKWPRPSDEQMNAVRFAERIFFPSTYEELSQSADPAVRDYWSEPVRMVNFITLQWGKGGGKDFTCRIMSLRVAYLLLCLPSPQEYYGFAQDDEIHLLNVASSARQANMAFFGPVRGAVMRKGCWLTAYADPLQGMIRYSNNVYAISGHSDAETQEGLNLLLGVADEIDAFKRQEELEAHHASASRESTKSAEAILKMMRSSMMTRFPQVGKNVRISYPRYKGSMIQKLTSEARKEQERRQERSRHYVSGPLATWDVNPLRSRVEFDQDYEDDPVESRAKYECDPAAAVNPFFSNEVAIESCVREVEQEPLQVRYEPELARVVHPDGESVSVRSWTTVYDFAASLKPKRGAIYAMHADLSVRKDRAGVCMAHVKTMEEQGVVGVDATGTHIHMSERRPVVEVDFLLAYEANLSATPPREIQVRWARELCLELRRRGFNVRWFSFDGFQSVDSMQILEANGIESKRVSTDLDTGPYRGLRDMFNENRILLPLCYPPDQDPDVLRELYGLSKMPNGKLDHPVDGCFAGSTRVPLLDGREVQIQDLADHEPVWVYSSDDEGNVIPALARGRATKKARLLCDVVLDSGAVVRCTPEHLWRLRDGSYREARALTSKDRLMPLNRSWDYNSGYERAWGRNGNRDSAQWTHKLVRAYLDGQPILSTEHVHHDNRVKTDNRPENLIRMDANEHRAHHTRDRHANDPEYVAALRASQRAYWATDEAKAAQREVIARKDTEAGKQRRVRQLHAERIELLRSAVDARSVGAAARRVGLSRNSAIAVLRSYGFGTWQDFQDRDGNNHRVRSVELVELPDSVWVYDLEVDGGYSNFALTAGVFVHNSKDMADALACAVQGAVQQGGQEDGGIAYVGGENFPSGQMNGLESMLPEGFVPPMAVSRNGFLPDQFVANHVQLGGHDGLAILDGAYDDYPIQQFSGPARPD